MKPILLHEYDEIPLNIITQTSLGNNINNYQGRTLLKGEEAIAQMFEKNFESTFQGASTPIYNCHGLTFASRRTGIYETLEIWKILNEEYIQIKSEKEVIEGDVIVYFSPDEQDILHSGIVTFVNKDSLLPDIKIISKVLKGKEIVHRPRKGPYFYGVIKYYRIGHKIEFRRSS